jgi:L-ascorbate metabolism protein UlaG (beta-lactamase superfamily)
VQSRRRRRDRARGAGRLIEPALADDAFVADVGAAGADDLHLWWLGQSGFLLKSSGSYLLLDPYLSDSLTRKYAGSETPHVRMTRRVVDPARLSFVDLVTASHGHTDHLDAETLRAIRPTVLLCPEAIRDVARERAGIEPRGLTVGATIAIPPFRIAAVRAEHPGADAALGYVVEGGGRRIYHAGDTLAFDGLGGSLRRFALDVAILPINGRLGNMSGREAAAVARSARAAIAIPCHYEMFGFNTASPGEFLAEAERLGQRSQLLRAGERLTLPAAAP